MSQPASDPSDGNPYHFNEHQAPPQPSQCSYEFEIFGLLRQFPGIAVEGLSFYGCNLCILSNYAAKYVWQEVFAAFFIPDIVLKPRAVWLEPDGSIVFAGFPNGDFANNAGVGDQMTIQHGKVFVCHVNDQGTAFRWGWVEMDSDGSGCPSNYRIHRGELIWKP